MFINETERPNNEVEQLFYVICQRFYISFFDENLLHSIVAEAVRDAQDPRNWEKTHQEAEATSSDV